MARQDKEASAYYLVFIDNHLLFHRYVNYVTETGNASWYVRGSVNYESEIFVMCIWQK